MDKLQVEVDRRAAELASASFRVAQEEARKRQEAAFALAENQARERALAIKAQEEKDRLAAAQKTQEELQCQESAWLTSSEGRLWIHMSDQLTALVKASESSADSLRQIRNAVACLILFGLLLLIVVLLAGGR